VSRRHSRTKVAAIAPSAPSRVAGIDALRGGALCLMFAYHFCFDLRFYRVIAADFENGPFWLGFRGLIVASFMTLVGVSLVLAERSGANPVHFWRRVGIIGACAIAASAASWIMFPRTYIHFGILHCIAAGSVLAWPLVRRPRFALAIGITTIIAGVVLSWPAFDHRALSWIGFTTAKPATEDYVPLAPWTGVIFVGIALGHLMARTGFNALSWSAGSPAWLRWLGRHSLAVYMLHQPALLGLLWLFVAH
jgi:uncharacterized membrane protein